MSRLAQHPKKNVTLKKAPKKRCQHISIENDNPFISLEDSVMPRIYANSATAAVCDFIEAAQYRDEVLKMEELLKESLPVGVSMISFKNIWDLKNSGFLTWGKNPQSETVPLLLE